MNIIAFLVFVYIGVFTMPLTIIYFYFKRTCGPNAQVVEERVDPTVWLLRLSFALIIVACVIESIWSFGQIDWSDLFSNDAIGLSIIIIGLIGVYIGDILLIWTLHHLGKNWTMLVSKLENHELVTTGPYQLARHPMYASLFIYYISYFLLSGDCIIFAAFLFNIICAAARIRIEERLMISEFGQQYIDYMKQRGAFCPCTLCDCGISSDEQATLLLPANENQA